eukprot:3680899-Rhodomonas_salina.2
MPSGSTTSREPKDGNPGGGPEKRAGMGLEVLSTKVIAPTSPVRLAVRERLADWSWAGKMVTDSTSSCRSTTPPHMRAIPTHGAVRLLVTVWIACFPDGPDASRTSISAWWETRISTRAPAGTGAGNGTLRTVPDGGTSGPSTKNIHQVVRPCGVEVPHLGVERLGCGEVGQPRRDPEPRGPKQAGVAVIEVAPTRVRVHEHVSVRASGAEADAVKVAARAVAAAVLGQRLGQGKHAVDLDEMRVRPV